mmetsp:Transcript_15275/g.48122  ORF Transcript_15275/g.48122 Transcript_15275/m.48122 type:complete len:422 (-) Transcript_15275:45-1310(-)
MSPPEGYRILKLPADEESVKPLLSASVTEGGINLAFQRHSLCAATLGAFVGAGFLTAWWVLASAGPQVQLWEAHLRPEYLSEPLGKKTVRYFDGYLLARAGLDGQRAFLANIGRALAPDVLFESVSWGPGGGPLLTRGRRAWVSSGEERNFRKAFGSTELFTQMMFFGESSTATTTSYGTLFWGGELFGMKPPNRWIELRVCDFYRIRADDAGVYGGLITYNFMMIDWADALRQIGRPLLPPAPLEEGVVLPPSADDGVPAPLSVLVSAQGRDAGAARAVVLAALHQDWAGDANCEAQSWHGDLSFYGPGGIGLARGAEQYRRHVLAPFRAAFGERTVAVELLTCEGNYCGALGRLHGHGLEPWLGLPTAGKEVAVRFAMHWRVVGGKVQEGWAIFDMPGLFQQLGLDFYAMAAAKMPGSP